TPTLSDEEAIAVTVKEVNIAPVLDAIGDKTIDEQTALTFTAHATDVDLPANTLTFSLVGAPQGATISADTGAFSWTPTEPQGPAVYSVDFRVTDDGSPALSDDEAVSITVNEDANLDAGPQANDGRPDNFRFVASGANLQGYLNDALVFVRSIASLVDGVSVTGSGDRSEERRVGKECRAWRWRIDGKE